MIAKINNYYRKNYKLSIDFFKTVQNKMHYAVSRQTAAEIIYNRADSKKENMGLTSWKNSPDGKIMKYDISIAKNYLNESEIKKLENQLRDTMFRMSTVQVENVQKQDGEQTLKLKL